VILSSQAASRPWRQRRPLPRRLFTVAAATVVAALAAGCEAGAEAPTQQWHQPTEGAAVVRNGISVRNAFVLGNLLNQTVPAGSSAGLFLALDNSNARADTLTGITAPGSAASVTLPGGSVTLNPNRAVLLTGPQPKVVLTNLTKPLTGGSFIKMVLTFQNAGTVTLSVPVMPSAQYYSTFSPPATPSPQPTVTPLHKRKHHNQGGASASPSPTPTTS
jgi:copper(I)-binding protein